ncbi:hypothetical protein C4H83_07160, partial [Neisseria gonorrhoeae]
MFHGLKRTTALPLSGSAVLSAARTFGRHILTLEQKIKYPKK